MTRRLWFGLLAAQLVGLAAIFGSDLLLHRTAPPPHLAALAPNDAFRLARSDGKAMPGGVSVLIEFRHIERRGEGRPT